MANPEGRFGHAAIGAILQDMDRYLPSETINRPGYRQCRTTYGLMNTTYARISVSESGNAEKAYKDLQALERDLRLRLNNLNAAKGIPVKMTQYLDEVRDAVEDALASGVTMDFLSQGIEDVRLDKPNTQPEKQPERVRMMPETNYIKVKAELAEAKKKIAELNGENNWLALRVKQLEMERKSLGT